MGVLGVNETAFDMSVSFKNKAITTMSNVNTNVSSISIPGGYTNAGEVESVLKGISTSISPKLEKYGKDFIDFQNYFSLLKDSEDSTDLESSIIRDENGNIVGLKTSEGNISLDGFQKKETENGIFYTWMDQKNSNFNISCNIYIPKVKELKGVVVYFTDTSGLGNHDNVRQIAAGTYKTDSIIIMPHNDEIYKTSSNNKITFSGISSGLAQKILEDVHNLAASFGIDEKNISAYGFSSGAKLATNLVSRSPEGSFKNLVLAGNTDNISEIEDPSVRIIVLSGAGEGENASFVKGQLDEFSNTHSNETEYYVLSDRADGKRVTHVYIDDTAATTDVFDGKNIFEYLGGEDQPETIVDAKLDVIDEIDKGSQDTTAGAKDYNDIKDEILDIKDNLDDKVGDKTEEPVVVSPPVKEEPPKDTPPVKEDKPPVKDNEPYVPPHHDDPAPTPTPEPTYILPENKFSDVLPNITGGNLDSMEISSVHANYDISGVNDETYNSYINSLKEAGYTLGTDGNWIKGNYILNLVRNNTDLNIYFKINM